MSLHATLTIDLGAVVGNWRTLKAQLPAGGECAAVVKANAYGLGVVPVATALYQAGCQRFFVATLEEGIELRAALKQAEIFVFHGIGRNEEKEFLAAALSPVLNSIEQFERWERVAGTSSVSPALHVDTGMCRLGVSEAEAIMLAATPQRLQAARTGWLMSHLVCAGTPEHAKNAEQLARFRAVREHLPQLKASLANSSGIFLGRDFHCDLARPGCSLYGISPNLALPNPVRSVVKLMAPIIQQRTLEKSETVGYEATHQAQAGATLATIALGYADGVLRSLSNRCDVWVEGAKVPVVGRVSMDMIIADFSTLSAHQRARVSHVEVLGENQSVDALATAAGTIGYEILTRLGARIKREYV